MVGRAPPPPPPRRWRLIVLIIAVVTVLAATPLILHFRTSTPTAGATNASIAPSAQPTTYRATIVIGTDAITGAPLTMELQAGTPAELQARVDETNAFIAARKTEGCVPVPLTEGGYAWLPAEFAAKQAAMVKATQAHVDEVNRGFVEDGKRRQAELDAAVAAQNAESARLNAELQAVADRLQAKQSAAEQQVAAEIAQNEAEMKVIADALLAKATTESDKADTRMLLLTAGQSVTNARGEKIRYDDRVRLIGFADRLPQFQRFVDLLRRRDILQAQGVSDLLRGGPNTTAADTTQVGGDNRPMVWRDDAPTEQRPLTYSGPGEVLANGDVKLGGSRTPAEQKQQTVSRRPPAIPDPIGLGERLVLIDVLVERFGEQRAGLIDDKKMSYQDLVELYWAKVHLSGKPSPYPESPSPP